MKKIFLLLFFLSITLSKVNAISDIERTIEFLNFSEDMRHYLIKIHDAQRGTYLSVRKLESGKRIKEVFIDPKSEPEELEKLKKRFKLNKKGIEGQTSPDGKYTLMGAKKGEYFEILAMRKDGKVAKFKNIKLENVEGKVVSEATLKKVIWSEDGRHILIILHQKLESHWGVDADYIYYYPFFGTTLNFK